MESLEDAPQLFSRDGQIVKLFSPFLEFLADAELLFLTELFCKLIGTLCLFPECLNDSPLLLSTRKI